MNRELILGSCVQVITYLSASLPVGDTAMLVLFTITFCMRPGLVSVR